MLTAAQSRELGVFLTPEQKQQLDKATDIDIGHPHYALAALFWSGKDAVIMKQPAYVVKKTGELHT